MKKILLVLSSFSIFLFTSAQNSTQCLTCKQGAHDGLFNNAISNTSAFDKLASVHKVGNGNSTFGQSYLVQNLCGFNYVYSSVNTQTRATWQPGTGFPTTCAIAGLPAGFVVQKAYLYYGCSYTEPTPPATTCTITNPTPSTSTIASVMIGQGGDVCWGATGTCGYRCDVTAAISGNGNYTITLNGFANADYEVDGVTLFIFYVDPAATYSGSVSLWDGLIYRGATNISSPGDYTWSGFTACTASSSASAFGCYGDIQNNVNAGVHTDDFNGSSATFPNDFWNTDVINTSVTACQKTCVYDTYVGNSSDCWLGVVEGLYWQYSTCTACSAMTVTSTDVNPSCGNNSGSITVNVVGGTAPYTYVWTPNVSTTNTATGLSAGTYSITVNDAACNVQTITVTLSMVNLVITDTQTNILCNGQTNGSITYTVSGGSPPYTYNWTPNISTTANATGLSAGTYTTVIEDQNGCATTENITITQPTALTAPIVPVGVLCNGQSNGSATATAGGGTPPYTYAWAPSGGNTNVASGLSAGTYSLVLTDNNGCSITSTTVITQPAVLAVTVTGPQTICAGSSGTLTASVTGGTAPYTYAWNPGGGASSTDVVTPTSTQTYTVNITDANGCVTSGTFIVVLGPVLTITTTGPASICSGATATICASAGGGTGGYTYLWQPGNFTTPCITVNPSSTTAYTVTVFDNCGSNISAIQNLPVNPLPAVNLSADLYQGCSPLCVQFRNKSTIASGGVESYVWTFGNGDSSHSENPIYCYSTPGNYSIGLTVVSDSGCSATLSKLNLINVYTHPNAAFTFTPQNATIISPTIQFTDQSTSQYGAIQYWWWNFGDGVDSTSNLENPSHIYQDTGEYCATLAIMDIHGCLDTATNCLIIDPVFNLYIPSAFSPNGDGKNDVFLAKGQYIKSFEMYIFDRWGMQLFYSDNILQGWNGTVKGGSTIAQEDTYVYKINVTDSKNKTHSYVGNVTLLK